MKKENIICTSPVTLGFPGKVMRELETSLIFAKDLGIQVIPSDEEENPCLFEVALSDFSPSPQLKILTGPPSIALWDLKRRALAYRWLVTLSLQTRQDLYEAWYLLKFLCQEIENPVARVLGKTMAELPATVSPSVLEIYRKDILGILEKPSAPNRIRNSLWKNYTHQVKKSGNPLAGIKDPNDPESLTTLIEELIFLENEAIIERIFFGTSPVIYKPLY